MDDLKEEARAGGNWRAFFRGIGFKGKVNFEPVGMYVRRVQEKTRLDWKYLDTGCRRPS